MRSDMNEAIQDLINLSKVDKSIDAPKDARAALTAVAEKLKGEI
jgi:hypothetical protein